MRAKNESRPRTASRTITHYQGNESATNECSQTQARCHKNQSGKPSKMSMKRWHHKSRNGCLQCRQRRIKCDESRPACRNCIRAEAADGCTYRENTAPATRPSSTTVASPRIPPNPGSPVPLSHRELELMHHFCISTSQALDDEPVISNWMRDVAPTLLIPHSNLVGGLLGLTAAHLAYQRPYDKTPYISLAYSHLNHALVQSQLSLQNLSSAQMTAEYAGALCLTAICTSLTIQALPVVDGNQQAMTPVRRFVTNFRAFRGISVVFWACSIHGRGLDQSFLPPNGSVSMALADEESLRVLDDVYMLIRANGQSCHTQADERKHAMYCAIFDELRNYVRAKTIRQVATVITGSTPAQWNLFCKLIEEGDIICSLVGLCYTVAYSHFDNRWFMGGLQGQVAEVLAARVIGAGELETKIGTWARRRVVPHNAMMNVPAKTGTEITTGSSSRPGTVLPSNDYVAAPMMGEYSVAEGHIMAPPQDHATRAAHMAQQSASEYYLLQSTFDPAAFLASQPHQ